MNLTISGHHVEVTPAIRAYVETKLERVKRHFDQVIDIAVILAVDNLTEKDKHQRAEINLLMSGKKVFVECTSQDMYAAIDCIMDKLDRQVMRYKSKVQDHSHTALKHLVEEPMPAEA